MGSKGNVTPKDTKKKTVADCGGIEIYKTIDDFARAFGKSEKKKKTTKK